MENIYGNVACGQAILQEFYVTEQKPEESVTDWALRLEELIKRAVDKGHTKEADKDEMLRTKLSYNQDSKNATKMYYASEKTFDSLLLKVRADEYELSQSKTKVDEKKKQTKVQYHPLQSSKDQLELLNSLMEKMDSMDKKVNILENSVGRGRGKGRGRGRGRGRGNGQDKCQNEQAQQQGEQKNKNQDAQTGRDAQSGQSKKRIDVSIKGQMEDTKTQSPKSRAFVK